MLEKQAWMKYGTELKLEWRQAMEEGKQAEEWKTVCEQISDRAGAEDLEKLAEEIREKLVTAPESTRYPYKEPSDLEGIRKEAKGVQRQRAPQKPEIDLRDRIAGAWIGRISGCLLGKPVECMMREDIHLILKNSGNYPLHQYMMEKDFTSELKEKVKKMKAASDAKCWADTIDGAAPVDDDTNYTVMGLKIVEEYGKEFRPDDVLEAWLSWMPMFSACTAERAAYRNAAAGMRAPETAVYKNPYREWIGAQIRGDFYGYVNPGDPQKAAEMAWRDASVSHVKNGIYGEMFAAAMLAAAAEAGDEVMAVIETGLAVIPSKSRLQEGIRRVIEWFRTGVTQEEVIDRIHGLFDERDSHDWCHTISNAMIVTAALLYGNLDFGNTVCLAVQAGFDTDCNGATAGSVVGMMLGERRIPEKWYNCYHKRLRTGVSGFTEVSVDELTDRTMELLTI